jgi:hypothetical protein
MNKRHTTATPIRTRSRSSRCSMALRWTYRWGLRHLLRLCGFAVEAEYSDFAGSAPAYGRGLIVVAQVAG